MHADVSSAHRSDALRDVVGRLPPKLAMPELRSGTSASLEVVWFTVGPFICSCSWSLAPTPAPAAPAHAPAESAAALAARLARTLCPLSPSDGGEGALSRDSRRNRKAPCSSAMENSLKSDDDDVLRKVTEWVTLVTFGHSNRLCHQAC